MRDPIQRRCMMWTIHDHPPDDPDYYVAREWVTYPGEPPRRTDSVILANDLEGLRETMLVDFRLARLPRRSSDDPTILETWL